MVKCCLHSKSKANKEQTWMEEGTDYVFHEKVRRTSEQTIKWPRNRDGHRTHARESQKNGRTCDKGNRNM